MALTSAMQKLQDELAAVRRDVHTVKCYLNARCEEWGEPGPFDLPFDEPIGPGAAVWGEDY